MSSQEYQFIKAHTLYEPFSDAERLKRIKNFYEHLKKRRTIRHFNSETFTEEIIHEAILAASSAPNGANLQPWHFSVVKSLEVKKKIRSAAEEEERAFYGGRANEEWLNDLKKFGTNANKAFLEEAPYLIVVFAKPYGINDDGSRKQHYYVKESVGIATGFLIAALHQAGLATLTHTPSPMGFLTKILERPKHEKPFILLVVGKIAETATVPVITKKTLPEISSFH